MLSWVEFQLQTKVKGQTCQLKSNMAKRMLSIEIPKIWATFTIPNRILIYKQQFIYGSRVI